MPRVEYPFYNFQTATDALRVYLPVRLSNPETGISTDIEMALVDTGADSCVIPGSLADALGHNLKHKAIKPSPTLGINGTHVDTYGHTFRLELLGPDAETVIWSNDNAVIDCIDAEVPILLGQRIFWPDSRSLLITLLKKSFSSGKCAIALDDIKEAMTCIARFVSKLQ